MIKHIRTYFIRGVLAMIPVGLSILVVRFLYLAIDQKVSGAIGAYNAARFPGLGIFILVVALYLLGLITSNVVGRQILKLVDRITEHIPLIKTTYQVGKQLASVLSLPEKSVFKRVVLVDYLKPGIWTIGFVTGTILDRTSGNTLLKVFVPTPPNPTSGTMVVVDESQVRDPGWTIDEALKAVISGGIIGPTEINL